MRAVPVVERTRPRVLVIDDEPRVRQMVCASLGDLGYHAEGAANGADGLALLEHQGYDLILTDLGMPGMTGWEVAEGVQRRAPGLSVILISGSATERDEDQARNRGVWLLRKPIDMQDLEKAVNQALRGEPEGGC